MVDLETLGTTPGSVILSIGAREFDPRRQLRGSFFYATINLASSLEAGLTKSEDTLKWWGTQPAEAQEVLREANSPITPVLGEVLTDFGKFFQRCHAKARIWGNGAAFDPVLLECAYEAAGLRAPWGHQEVMCYRTIRHLAPQVEPPTFIGVAHNALDDADMQVTHMLEVYRALGWAI